jgi:hypothetical protein
MAFVLDVTKTAGTEGVNATTLTFVEWFTAADGLLAGDYIMVVCSNQTGTATALELTSATGSWTKLDSTDSPRVGTIMRSQIWWHKYDGTTLPTEPTASEGANTAWVAAAWVVRDAPDVADQSWIDVSARADNSTFARVLSVPSVTTTEADCLLLTVLTSTGASAFETPDRFWGMDFSVAKVGDNPLVSNPTQRAVVASRAQFTAGATPTYDYLTGNPNGLRSQIWTIAIKNRVGGAKPIGIANPPTRVFDYYEDNTFLTAATVFTSLSTIHTTIDGQTTFAPNTINNVIPVQGLITNNPPILFWYRSIRIAPPTATTGVSGVRWDLPATTDYTTGLWVLFSQRDSSTTDSLAGIYHYFEDSNGNWAVYRPLTRLEGVRYNTLVRYLPDEPIVDGSVTPVDLTDITKRGVAYQQIASSTQNRDFRFARECVQPFDAPLTLIGGGPANPITARTVARMLDSGGAWRLSFAQGQSQQVITMPYQLGDGIVATYVDDEAQALEYPRAGGILGYTVAAGRQEIRIKASAADTVLLDAGIKGSSRIHNFVFDSATSTSATYGMAGTFLGWVPTLKTGLTLRGGTYIGCGQIDVKGADFSDSLVKSSVATAAAMRIDTGAVVRDCVFTRGLEAAAILIPAAGSYDLRGTSFSGYTTVLDVTAASGTVTIELEAGQPQPTFVTAGASVTFTQPPTTLNILRPNFLSGSTYVLRNTTQDTEIEAGTVGAGGLDLTLTSGVDYTSGDQLDLRVGYVSGTTAKLPIQELLTAPSVTAVNSAPTSQQDYTVYNSLGINGSSRNEFTADYVNNQVDIIVASDFYGQNFMAWWVYNEATLNGLRNFLGAYTLLDEGNARNNASVVSVKFDNTTASNIKQIDNARIFASDGSYPVLNPSSGGGAIDINWRVPVQIINTDQDYSAMAAALLSAAQVSPIHSDVRKMNSATMYGTGVAEDQWRGTP